jgi:hypothetical protein
MYLAGIGLVWLLTFPGKEYIEPPYTDLQFFFLPYVNYKMLGSIC